MDSPAAPASAPALHLPEAPRCLNCGTALQGPFCHACGQEGASRNLSLGALAHDFLGDFFSFDGRFFRTLRPLFSRPGALTVAFAQGHHAPYVPPIRLYVFSSFVLFLVITLLKMDPGAALVNTGGGAADSTGARTLTASNRAELEAEIDSLRSVLAGTPATPAADTTAPASQPDPFHAEVGGADVSRSAFGRFLKSKTLRVSDDPMEFVRFIGSKVPLLLFLLVPVFAAELKVLYIRRKKFYVQHLVFALHLHAFAFLLLALLLVLSRFWVPVLLGVWLVPLYLFLALRRVYEQSRVKTFFKEWALLGMHSFVASLVLVVYVFVLLAVY